MKPYPLMQLRNKAVNYYLEKDKLLLFFDVNYNDRNPRYRVIFYNKDSLVSEESTVLVDANSALTNSASDILRRNYCKHNETFDYDALSCQQYLFMPLS